MWRFASNVGFAARALTNAGSANSPSFRSCSVALVRVSKYLLSRSSIHCCSLLRSLTFASVEQGFEVLPVIEQGRLIRSIVQRVDYDGGQSKLALTLDPAGLVAVLEEQTKRKEN